MSSQTLYQRLLGEDFNRLPSILQRFHSLPHGGKASGSVTVIYSGSWLRNASVARSLLRLPPPGENIPLSLEVLPQGARELWIRRFGREQHRLLTLQWQEDGFLIEKSGPLLFVFRVSADEQGITFHFQHNRLEPFPLRPRFSAIRVEAEAAAHTEDEHTDSHWHIRVHITSPLLGRLIAYEGKVTPTL